MSYQEEKETHFERNQRLVKEDEARRQIMLGIIKEFQKNNDFKNGDQLKSEWGWEDRKQLGTSDMKGKNVWLLQNKKESEKKMVLKTWSNVTDLSPKDFEAIINLHNKYYHSNIVNYESIYLWEELHFVNQSNVMQTMIGVSMEYFPNTLKSVFESGKKFKEMELIYLLQSILNVISYLQEHQTSLFNIKPENIFISDLGTYVISDFGQCQQNDSGFSQQKKSLSKAEASIYLCKEFNSAIEEQKEGIVCNYVKTDIFALGVVLLESRGLLPKPEARTAPLEFEKAKRYYQAERPFFKELLKGMLQDNQETRFNLNGIDEFLNKDATKVGTTKKKD